MSDDELRGVIVHGDIMHEDLSVVKPQNGESNLVSHSQTTRREVFQSSTSTVLSY